LRQFSERAFFDGKTGDLPSPPPGRPPKADSIWHKMATFFARQFEYGFCGSENFIDGFSKHNRPVFRLFSSAIESGRCLCNHIPMGL
jgi:hypothetical protein